MEESKIFNEKQELVEVSSALMYSKIRSYLENLGAREHPQTFILTEVFSESVLNFMRKPFRIRRKLAIDQNPAKVLDKSTTQVGNIGKKLLSFFEPEPLIEESFWKSPLFANGQVYFHGLSDIILAHSYLNPGYLTFVKQLIYMCGLEFNIIYRKVEYFVRDFFSNCS